MGLDRMYRDDSMIVRAMDDAIMNYKIMHGQEVLGASADGGGVCNGCGGTEQLNRSLDEDSSIKANTVDFAVDKTPNTSEANENIIVEPCPISCTHFSDALHIKESQQEPIDHSNLNLKGEEDYNQLLKQYYELEEKRQKVLEQLYQYGAYNLNYQGDGAESGIGTQWGMSSAFLENPISSSQPSHNHAIPSNLPSGYPIFADTGPQSLSLADGDIIKTAMDSAAIGISSMSAVNKEKESEVHSGIIPQTGASSETDIKDLVNAWYYAGFYSGKYYAAQSYAKKQ